LRREQTNKATQREVVSQKINLGILDGAAHFMHFSSCALKMLKLQSNSQKVLLLPSTIHSKQLLHFSLKYLITTHSSTLLVLVLILNKKTIRKLNPLSHLLFFILYSFSTRYHLLQISN